MSQGELFSLAGVSPAELWVPHLFRVLFERDSLVPITIGALIDGTPVSFVSDNHLLLAALPTAAHAVLLIHLPRKGDEENRNKDGENDDLRVYSSLLSREKLSLKAKGHFLPLETTFEQKANIYINN